MVVVVCINPSSSPPCYCIAFLGPEFFSAHKGEVPVVSCYRFIDISFFILEVVLLLHTYRLSVFQVAVWSLVPSRSLEDSQYLYLNTNGTRGWLSEHGLLYPHILAYLAGGIACVN